MAKKKTKKVLRLRPGNHQFVPGANSFHNNENTSSDELEWYMSQYPHIENLLEPELEEEIKEENNSEPQV